MGLKRRTFLQQGGLALLALGISETALSILGETSFAGSLLERYYQALAQPSARKLALLVGINQYSRNTALSGCVTDVELQRELLIHRFGFNPSDILTLTDQQATRENIETAFLEHLSKQASAEDVVVFHFSGYGSRIQGEKSSEGAQNSLLPVDSMPVKEDGTGNNLLEETLLLLLHSLPTDQVTTVLDTSYTNASKVLQGNLRIRSCPKLGTVQPSPEELAFQEQLLLRLNASRDQLKIQRQAGQIPGILLAAAGPTQPATEAAWGGFSAGLFTYALTQHLWQASPPMTVQVSLSRAAGMVEQLVGKEQQPQLRGQQSTQQSLLAYHSPPAPSTGADGVVMMVEENGKLAQLWLAGLPAPILEYYGVNSLLTIDSSSLESQTETSTSAEAGPSGVAKALQLQIRSREGLTAKARLINTSDNSSLAGGQLLQVGQLVQESVRVLPRNIGLTVATDASLERIERVDATSAFASVPYVSSVVPAGEQSADYLFAKVESPESGKGLDSGLNDATASYGLFSLGHDPLPNTAGAAGEAVKVAAKRLVPTLKTLLAAKLWRLTTNEGSSRLGIRATLEVVSPTPQVVMQRETLRRGSVILKTAALKEKGESSLFSPVEGRNLKSSAVEGGIPTLSIGSRIRYRVQNYSDRPVYLTLFGLDSSGSAFAVYPLPSSPASDTPETNHSAEGTPLQDAVIPAGATLTVPQPSTSFEWIIHGPVGLAETQLICSREPLTHTRAAMSAEQSGKTVEVGELINSLDVARAVLQDLHTASAVSAEAVSISSDTYALDVNAWATLSFVYQVV